MKPLLSLVGATLAAALLVTPTEARADVVCGDVHDFLALPSGGLHLASLATSAIGLGVSEARRGWYNAAIATVATNYVQTTLMVTTDAAEGDGCGSQISEPNMVVESVALAATSGLLVAVLVVEPRDADDEEAAAPSLMASVAPRDAGAVALLGGTF